MLIMPIRQIRIDLLFYCFEMLLIFLSWWWPGMYWVSKGNSMLDPVHQLNSSIGLIGARHVSCGWQPLRVSLFFWWNSMLEPMHQHNSWTKLIGVRHVSCGRQPYLSLPRFLSPSLSLLFLSHGDRHILVCQH